MSVPRVTQQAAQARAPQRTAVAMAVIMTGVLMTAVDTTIVVLALPEIQRGLHVSLSAVVWVIISFLLVITVLATQVGRLGDMFGRVRMYEMGFAVFVLGSLGGEIRGTGRRPPHCAAGVQAVLLALDSESLTGRRLRQRLRRGYVVYRGHGAQAWGAVDPLKGEQAIAEAVAAVRTPGARIPLPPDHGTFRGPRHGAEPAVQTIAGLGVPADPTWAPPDGRRDRPADGARIEHARPLAIDNLAARFPSLTMSSAHPGWPWTDE